MSGIYRQEVGEQVVDSETGSTRENVTNALNIPAALSTIPPSTIAPNLTSAVSRINNLQYLIRLPFPAVLNDYSVDIAAVASFGDRRVHSQRQQNEDVNIGVVHSTQEENRSFPSRDDTEARLRHSQQTSAGFIDDELGPKCLFCFTRINTGQSNQDPAVLHAQFSPQCQYMILKYGKGFVEAVKKIYETKQINVTSLTESDVYKCMTESGIRIDRTNEDAMIRLLMIEAMRLGFEPVKIYQAIGALRERGVRISHESLINQMKRPLVQLDDASRIWNEEQNTQGQATGVAASAELSYRHPPKPTGAQYVNEPIPGCSRWNYEQSGPEQATGVAASAELSCRHPTKPTGAQYVNEPIPGCSRWNYEKSGPEQATASKLSYQFPVPRFSSLTDGLYCSCCFIKMVEVMIYPCQHGILCIVCALSLDKCPRCETIITSRERIYFFK